MTCVAGFVKQVVPLSLQNDVSYCRGCLAGCSASGRFYRCFALRKGVWEPKQPSNECTMNQRTKHFQLRLTPEEAHRLREKSKSYSSVSHYIRSAVAEYSDINAKQRLELINELGTFYRKFQNELSWAGGNLNQSVKRANELSVAGLLSQAYLQEVLLPVITETQKTLNEIKRELYAVTKKAAKL